MGMSLPPLYRGYLLSANGGQPSKYLAFAIPEIAGDRGKVMLGALYGIGADGSSLDLLTEYEEYKDVIPNGFIPIGEDPGGNQLLLATDGRDKEAIFFWDRAGFLAKHSGKNLFRIADGITLFLESLDIIPDC
jgi:hypothetical protein